MFNFSYIFQISNSIKTLANAWTLKYCMYTRLCLRPVFTKIWFVFIWRINFKYFFIIKAKLVQSSVINKIANYLCIFVEGGKDLSFMEGPGEDGILGLFIFNLKISLKFLTTKRFLNFDSFGFDFCNLFALQEREDCLGVKTSQTTFSTTISRKNLKIVCHFGCSSFWNCILT